MKKWKVRYKVIKSNVSDPELVDNADRIVRKAIEISRTTGQSLLEVLEAMWITLKRLNAPISSNSSDTLRTRIAKEISNSGPSRRKKRLKHLKLVKVDEPAGTGQEP